MDEHSKNERLQELRKAIEAYYLPRQLIEAIHDIGHIPTTSRETQVGVGFIDIADYTYLSKFLSPNENQTLLNGLYTAFQIVLNRHNGFLNKLEGDSLMFQFDSIIDKRLATMQTSQQLEHIARELFYTCIEMQRVCALFNQASDRFLDSNASPEARRALQAAFDIIKNLRHNSDAARSLQAFFQVRIRIGANIGEVTIGNFGPDGAKQWDVIGLPVINAKRMEATAPVGGLRISEEYYRVLENIGLLREYHSRFKREAYAMGSVYKDIALDELFSKREVVIREKKGAMYQTYSVQVNPSLPETIAQQVEQLLYHGKNGAKNILDILRYYRGNRYVIDTIEKLFKEKQIVLRKEQMLELIHPKRFRQLKTQSEVGAGSTEHDATKQSDLLRLTIDKEYSLYDVFQLMGSYQDIVQQNHEFGVEDEFVSYENSMALNKKTLLEAYEQQKLIMVQRTYFFEVVTPLVYQSILASILEQQFRTEEVEELLPV